jgi:hypothetical protein
MNPKNVILAILVSLSAISAKAANGDIKQQRVQLVASFLQDKGEEFCDAIGSSRNHVTIQRTPTCLEFLKVEQRTIVELVNSGPGYDILRGMLLDRGLKTCDAQGPTIACWEMIQSKVAAYDAIAAANYQVIDILIGNFNDKANAYGRALYSTSFVPSQKAFVQLVTELAK